MKRRSKIKTGLYCKAHASEQDNWQWDYKGLINPHKECDVHGCKTLGVVSVHHGRR